MVAILEDQLVLKDLKVPNYYRVVHASHEKSGLDAIIAIHSLEMGRASVGGTRIYPYRSFDDALDDALRLSRGMTLKSAATESGWGGGKSVINVGPKGKTPELLTAFAEAVNRLEGAYICAEDSGCGLEDVAIIAKTTPYVVGLPSEKSSGNPSPFTAWGVFRGIEAVMNQLFNKDSVEGRAIAIQGLGSVGMFLAELLFWHGAKLVVTDLNMDHAREVAKKFSAKIVSPEEIYSEPCDLFCPCALGGVINPSTIEQLRCRAIAGSANNQLLSENDAEQLRHFGILYAPDFVINAGGLINVSEETTKNGYDPFVARKRVDGLYDQLTLIFDIAKKNGISTQKAVMQLINYRLQHGIGKRKDHRIYMHHANFTY